MSEIYFALVPSENYKRELISLKIYSLRIKRLISTFYLIMSLACGSYSESWSNDFQKGMKAFKRSDFIAIKEWILLGEDCDEKAQYFLGLIYYKGKGVPQDYKVALKWYTLQLNRVTK